MVDSGAAGVVAAGPGAGVHTLLLDTGLVAGTLGIEDALGPTGRRGPHIPSQTAASLMSVHLPAQSVGSTGRGHTRNVGSLYRGDHLGVLVTVVEGVATVALGTGADGVVVDHFAFSIGSTGARTGVDTLLLDAGFG